MPVHARHMTEQTDGLVPERSRGTSLIPHRVHGFVFRRRMRGAPGGRREAKRRKAVVIVFRFFAGLGGGISEANDRVGVGVPAQRDCLSASEHQPSRACDAGRNRQRAKRSGALIQGLPVPRVCGAVGWPNPGRTPMSIKRIAGTTEPTGRERSGCCRMTLVLTLLLTLLLL